MKYFIGADIEAPHLSYYEIIGNDPHFFGRWAWAAKDGMPDDGAVYFDMREDAQEMVDDLKKTGAGIPYHADTIRVVELDL